MLRLFIIAFLTYLAYVVLKRAFGSKPKDIQAPKRPNGVVDELVQDPVCHTYIPRSTAYALKLGGKEYFFCGKECAQKFQKEVKEAKREE